MADPIHQFQLVKIGQPLFKIGATEVVLTQSSLYMIGAVAFITLFMMMGTAGRAHGAGPPAVDGRDDLRIRRQHRPKFGRP